MEYQQQIHIGPGLESICRIPQKTNADTADTGKVSAKQKKSKWRCKFICPPVWKASAEVKEDKCRYTKCRESICKIPQKSNADTSVLQKVSPALLSH